MFTYKLLSTGLTRQTPTRSRFACKYAGLEVVAGLRKLQRNGAIRSIISGEVFFETMRHVNAPASSKKRSLFEPFAGAL